MTQDRPRYQKDLAAILLKAQGRVDAESGKDIHVGDEVARLRDTLDQLSKAAKASEAGSQPLEAKPVAWMFQHEETGQTLIEDAQQVERGFEKNNPRYQRICPLYTAAPAPVVPSVWLTSENGEQWPRVGDKYLVRMNGHLQHEIYEFDQGDDGCGGGEYFWSRDDLDECPVFNSEKDEWVSLADIDAMLSAAQEQPNPYLKVADRILHGQDNGD